MKGIRLIGGMTALIHWQSYHKRWVVLFSKRASEKIKSYGFKSAQIFYQPYKLKIVFSREESPTRSKIWSTQGRLLIKLEENSLLSALPILSKQFKSPFYLRKATVSLRGNEATLIFPGPLYFLSEKPFLVKPIKSEPFGYCFLYANFKGQYAYLYFDAKTSKYLKKKNVKGIQAFLSQGGIILRLEKNCAFSCPECPRIDCLPLNYSSSRGSFHARLAVCQLLKSNSCSLKFLASLPLSKRKGKVFFTENSFMLFVELPFLRGGE